MKKDYSKISRERAEKELSKDVSAIEDSSPTEPESFEVVGCEKLNVRKRPNTSSEIVTVLDKGAIVISDGDTRTDGWRHIYLKDGKGTEGFCMEKFLKKSNI